VRKKIKVIFPNLQVIILIIFDSIAEILEIYDDHGLTFCLEMMKKGYGGGGVSYPYDQGRVSGTPSWVP
jgi:hypothetical protein